MLPPSELVAMANERVGLAVPQIPVWALAASAPTDWAILQIQQEEEHIDLPCWPLSPPSSPERRGQVQQQQQNHSFETAGSGGSDEWEPLSVPPSASAEVDQPMFPELDDHPVDGTVDTLETHFFDAYPLAMTAAGLAVGHSKSKSGSSSASCNPRSGVYRLAFLMAFIIALVGVHLEGLPHLNNASVFSSTQQYIDLIPAMPKAGRTFMVKISESSLVTNTQEVRVLEELKTKPPKVEQAIASVRQARLRIQQPFSRPIQQIHRLWKTSVSKVVRRKNNKHA